MQRAGNVHRRDLGDILAVGIHDEQLQGWIGITLRWLEAVAVADEGDAAAGQRTRRQIEDAVAEAVELRRRIERIALVPASGAGVRRELAVGQLFDLARRQTDAVDVRALIGQIAALVVQRLRAQIGKTCVVDPLRIE